jgi:tetratricopeptide (TPR) repeat protein
MLSHDRRVLFTTCLLVLSAPVPVRAESLLSPLNRATELTRQGENLGLQQKVDDASAAFEEAGTLWQKLTDQNPSDVAERQGLAACYENFGDMLVANNRLDGGLAKYQKSLQIRQALANQDSGNPDRLHDLVESLARIGRVAILQHQLSNSLQFYQKACTAGDRLARNNPPGSVSRR